MSRWRIGIITLVALALGFMSWSLYKEHRGFRASVSELRAKRAAVEDENRALRERVEYYKIPENLLKEARARFNFTKPGEKLLIVIPKEDTSTSSSP